MNEFESAAAALVDAGRQLYAQGMVPATSGNFSAKLADGQLAITVSGRHKGKLDIDDIMRVDSQGVSLDDRRPSAETLLHVGIYHRYPEVRVVLHPHSVNATVLSRLCGDWLELQDYEILKAFPGIDTHACTIRVPVFDNDQDITRLAKKVDHCLAGLEVAHGYLIRGHGFYSWGESMEDAMRYVEAFEFLFDCELRLRGQQS
jgi:methylthioribulose-1-phosphate dehydratase